PRRHCFLPCTTLFRSTAQLAARSGVTVLTLGDQAYPTGSARDFAQCYAPSWGALMNRTRPTIGNHEYGDSDETAATNDPGSSDADRKSKSLNSSHQIH